jgi:hypothetical protein
MSNSCLFCGAKGGGLLTNEHVIPRWLLEHLGLPKNDKLFQGVASSATETLVKQPRIHSSFNFVQGRVCENCNTGWMSRLEGTAKPILVPLIEKERTIDSLTPEEADVVGKWASKTAYMHSWTSPLKQPVQLDHLKTLCGDGGKPVAGIAVFGMQSNFKKPSAYYQRRHWPQFCNLEIEVPAESPREAYKIGLQFRHLYLLVAFWPNTECAFTRVLGTHLPVFPRRAEPQPVYLKYLRLGNGLIDQLAEFCNWLAITHR